MTPGLPEEAASADEGLTFVRHRIRADFDWVSETGMAKLLAKIYMRFFHEAPASLFIVARCVASSKAMTKTKPAGLITTLQWAFWENPQEAIGR